MIFLTSEQSLRRELTENNKVNDDLREVRTRLREALDSAASFEPTEKIQVFKTGVNECILTTSKALKLSTELHADRDRLLNLILEPYTAADTETQDKAIEQGLKSLITTVSGLVAPLEMVAKQAKALSKHAEPSSAFHQWAVKVGSSLTAALTIVGSLAYAFGHKTLCSGSFIGMGVGALFTVGAYYLGPDWRTVTRATERARRTLGQLPPSLIQTIAP
ncbi:hypothetical protein FRC09_012086 [Ceratobasidium sp. 395]|nr:hypothetical protein FRC09_012086 [Ceratobasidium sp. 395]